MADQTRRVLLNLEAVLKAAGSSLDRGRQDDGLSPRHERFRRDERGLREFFPAGAPARATVQVARLPKDVAVEIDCIALAT